MTTLTAGKGMGSAQITGRAQLAGKRWGAGAIGIVAVLIIWTMAGYFEWFKGTIPTPLAVIDAIGDKGWDYYINNFTPTIELSLRGFLWGNVLAIVLALLVVIIPLIEGVATHLAIISYCTPIIAVAPIVQVAFAEVQTMIGTLSGLRSPHQASLDLVKVYGGGTFSQLVRVRIISALPSTFGALKIAAPAAVLGAVLGEFLAMPEKGAGPALIIAQQSGDIPAVWAIALVAGAVAGIGYGIVAFFSVFVTRYSTGMAGSK